MGTSLAMVIRAGRLRNRIVIQQATEAQSTTGKPVPTWSTFAERYADIMPQQGQEFLAARSTYATLTHLVELRYVAGVRPKMRVLFGSRVLEIIGVVREDERAHVMRLACEELDV